MKNQSKVMAMAAIIAASFFLCATMVFATPDEISPAETVSAEIQESSEDLPPAISENFSAKNDNKDDKEEKDGFFFKKKKKCKLDVDALVRDGIINQETGDKVKTYLKEHKKEHKAEFDKIQKMTPDERKAYFEQKKSEGRLGIWAEMVTAGIITQEESDAIKSARTNCEENQN